MVLYLQCRQLSCTPILYINGGSVNGGSVNVGPQHQPAIPGSQDETVERRARTTRTAISTRTAAVPRRADARSSVQRTSPSYRPQTHPPRKCNRPNTHISDTHTSWTYYIQMRLLNELRKIRIGIVLHRLVHQQTLRRNRLHLQHVPCGPKLMLAEGYP